jgi:hypothetical protein
MSDETRRPDPVIEIFSFFIAFILAIAVLIEANDGYRVRVDAPEYPSQAAPY